MGTSKSKPTQTTKETKETKFSDHVNEKILDEYVDKKSGYKNIYILRYYKDEHTSIHKYTIKGDNKSESYMTITLDSLDNKVCICEKEYKCYEIHCKKCHTTHDCFNSHCCNCHNIFQNNAAIVVNI